MVKYLIKKTLELIKRIDLEAFIWLMALLYLTFINPYEPKHLNLCLFSLAGIENCPGCGLGKSISLLFHGDFIASFQSHPLGIPAIILIIRRIFQLVKNKTNSITNNMEAING